MATHLSGLSYLLVLACACTTSRTGGDAGADTANREVAGDLQLELRHPEIDPVETLPTTDSFEVLTWDGLAVGVCIPNPCKNPPPPACLGDDVILVLSAAIGVCTDVDGVAVCDYPTATVDCGRFGYLEGCRHGPCNGGCSGDCDTMVTVPEGGGWVGCGPEPTSGCDGYTMPYHEVFLEEYGIDRTEVTCEAFAHFLNMLGVPDVGEGCFVHYWGSFFNIKHIHLVYADGLVYAEPGFENYPAVSMFPGYAATFCKIAGKRLCSSEEWEKAARGDDERLFPWGNEHPTCDLAVIYTGLDGGCGANDAMPVGSIPAGASPYGALDMAGNVWEWVGGEGARPSGDPSDSDSGNAYLMRGGGWDIFGMNGFPIYEAYESSYPPGGDCGYGYSVVGFRCCKDG